MFDGLKVPTAASALAAPEHAEEVCLTKLLKNIEPL
jgi:serine/threonine protein kinase